MLLLLMCVYTFGVICRINMVQNIGFHKFTKGDKFTKGECHIKLCITINSNLIQ